MIVSKKVKLHPTKTQNQKMIQSAGTSRWAYNWTIAKQQENYSLGNKFIQDGEIRKELTQLKKTEELNWLNDYSNNITKKAIKDACDAYKKFFKKLSMIPKFKSRKKSRPSFYQDTEKIKFKDGKVRLEKIGWVNLAEKDRIPEDSKYCNPRITNDGLDWYVSVGIEVEKPILDNVVTEPIGIDLGIKDLAVVSNGQTFKNINKQKKIKKLKKRLKRQQKKASKLYEKIKKKENVTKSYNLMKQELQIKKTYKTMTDVRTNHIHQMTSKLVRNNPEYITIETLNISNMMKNKHISRAIQEQKLFEVIRQLRYKCDWYGIELREVDKWFPSSKTCSDCGFVHTNLQLKDRIFKCPSCGFEINRDYNASINLRECNKYKIYKATH